MIVYFNYIKFIPKKFSPKARTNCENGKNRFLSANAEDANA